MLRLPVAGHPGPQTSDSNVDLKQPFFFRIKKDRDFDQGSVSTNSSRRPDEGPFSITRGASNRAEIKKGRSE
jgi:hypothetical protein